MDYSPLEFPIEITDEGAWFRAALSAEQVSKFADKWPCFGPRVAMAFEFDKNNGDLIGLDGDTPDHDGYGVSCLADDVRLTIALAY